MKYNRKILIFSLVLSLVSAYCKGSVNVSQAGKTGSAIAQTSQYIDADMGGTISLGRNLSLSIPAGALDKSTEIGVAQVNTPAAADGVNPLVAYEFSEHGLQFHKPALLKLCYSADAVRQQGLNEDSIAIYHDDNSNYAGYGGSVDTVNHCVTSEINHFSVYFAAAQSLLSVNAAPNISGASFLPSTPIIALPMKIRTVVTDFNAAGRGQVANIWLHYCVGNATVCNTPAQFSKVAMLPDTTSTVTTNRYTYTIPANKVTSSGITYFFEAIDNLRASRISTTQFKAVTATAVGLTIAPATFDIAAGFSRQLNVQVIPSAGSPVDIDFAAISVGNGIGNAALNNQGVLVFDATTSGDPLTTGYRTGTITASIGSLTASATANVWPGKLTAIQILDSAGVVLGSNIALAPGATFDFDARGLDAFGNTSLVYPAWIVTNPLVGSIPNNDGVFNASSSDGQSGGVLAIVDNIAGSITVNVAAPPQVTLSLGSSVFSENGGSTTVTAYLSQTYLSPVTVNLAFGGTAAVSDYVASAAAIVIPAGQTSASITVTGVDNVIPDGPRTLIVDISNVVNGTEQGVQQVMATIQDDETAPYPIAATPIDGSTNNPVTTSVTVTFSQPMNPATMTTSTTTSCTGSLQLSADNFTTCVAMNATLAVMSNGDATVTFTPAASLANNTLYKIRATTAAQAATGARLITTITSPSGWTTEGVVVVGPWMPTGSMATPRLDAAAVRLNDGRILIVGGTDAFQYLSSSEIFDPNAASGFGGFSPTGSLLVKRGNHSATLLNDGRVLVVGGYNNDGGPVNTAEIFDSSANMGTGAFTSTVPMNRGRYEHTATLLPDGRVLIAGGHDGFAFQSSVEIFDPTANAGNGAFNTIAPMVAVRSSHRATLLPTGKVLICGGYAGGSSYQDSCEIFDPVANSGAGGFQASVTMSTSRAWFTMTLLNDGRVLIAGGATEINFNGVLLNSAEIFDPSQNSGLGGFTQTGNMVATRFRHGAAVLPDGRVLLTGGPNGAEIFDPQINMGGGGFIVTANMSMARAIHQEITLADGRIIVIGGATTETAEIYQ